MWTESDPYPFGAWIKTGSHPPDEQAMDVKDAGYVSVKATCYGKSIGTHRHTSLASYLDHSVYGYVQERHWHSLAHLSCQIPSPSSIDEYVRDQCYEQNWLVSKM
jgi:hypothetical protein